MLAFLQSHQVEFWIALGALALIIELTVLGAGSFVLLFMGLGALATGAVMAGGLLPELWVAGAGAFGGLSCFFGVALWRPLRRFSEGEKPPPGQGSDFLGLRFKLPEPLVAGGSVSIRYSGVSWELVSQDLKENESLDQGCEVIVVGVEPGRFMVALEP
ncbi:MAG: NfeD family protein [Pseudomonadales bacterium]